MTKSPDAFRTISEAADDLSLPQHVLRFWETRFSQIKPMKRGGGRRYYRPDDVDLLRGIRRLLYDEGYTIRGVQRILREQGNRYVIGVGQGVVDLSEGVPQANGDGAHGENASQIDSEAGAIPEELPVQPEQAAMSVEEFHGSKTKANKGLLNRLRGGASYNDEELDVPPVSEEDRRHLQSTLYELLECKRLLDQVRSD